MTLSEASLVRLAINALQGLESSLTSIEKICALFRSDPADRSFHRTPSLWNRSLSTLALERILRSLGCLGCEVFLLRKFICYFTNVNCDEAFPESVPRENKSYSDKEGSGCPQFSLVNQAFAVSVCKILDGYISALDTLCSSVRLRRSSNIDKMSSSCSPQVGCLSSVGHSEVTLLEVYLHTKALRSQIEALGCICDVHDVALRFSLSPLEDLGNQTKFSNFPTGGNLLTYLYTQLKVADPVHCALLKILFLHSCEPYFEFIRSWIFKAKVNDPFNEFIVAKADSVRSCSLYDTGILIDFASATIREQKGVSVPCFLREFLIPIFRAGQQLQVLMKLLELCDDADTWNRAYEDFLPYWSGMSNVCSSYASHLAFTKEGIEMMVLARSNYYKIMLDKLENGLMNLEFKYHQVIPHSILPTSFSKGGGNLEAPFEVNGRSISPSTKNGSQNMSHVVANYDACSLTEEFSYEDDPLETSEHSYLNSSEEEEEDEFEKMIELPHDTADLEKMYLSALEFNSCTSSDISVQKPTQSENSSIMGNGTCQLLENADLPGYSPHPQHVRMNTTDTLLESDGNFSCMIKAQNHNDQIGSIWSSNGIPKNPSCSGRGNRDDAWLNVFDYQLNEDPDPGVQEKTMSQFGDLISTCGGLAKDAANKHKHPTGDSFSSKPWQVKYHPKYLCANPMLTRTSFGHMTSKVGERYCTDYIPSFDFRSVKDPFTVCVDRLISSSDRQDKLSISVNNAAVVTNYHNNGHGGDANTNGKKNSYDMHSPLGLKINDQEQVLLPNVSGGSCWELLLCGSDSSADVSSGERRNGVTAVTELPLDFVLEKCLLEEIQLQYNYVSKLTIKLLEEGFCLQEHLLALRRYHMMGSADWADLFIMSLSCHKWYGKEADKSVSEIQGLLELSLQRSSCERDRNKDRLLVYMKEQGSTSLPTFASGIRSFNILGLGYRVDWPVSIVLTPGALKIYAGIFNFLLQVKLALSSLTEVWCSFKELFRFTNQYSRSDSRNSEVSHFNIMVKVRHQIFHFVTTLQQYVQSQLSHVSWCRFLHSLKHKVKDLMDLNLVHMDYLYDSQRICFLSNDIEQIAEIVQSILQCALDFKSASFPSNSAGLDGSELNKISHVDVGQVLTIKETFDRKIRQLYLCYLNSPKSVEFGLPRFWEYLNYNEHYSEVIGKEMGHHTFSF